MSENRAESGRFVKGISGNPGGRPKGLAEKVRKATKDGSIIIRLMVAVAEGKAVGGQKPTIRDRLDAARWLADRGWGKAVPAMEYGGPGSGAIEADIRFHIPDNSRQNTR